MGAEAYRKRKRYLYALFFEYNHACYIGQSVNPKRRAQQHASPKGQWNMSFIMKTLCTFEGTKEECEQLERAYRLKAQRKGWRVYGLPHVFVNPKKQATLGQWWTSLFLPWPKRWVKRHTVWPYLLFGCALIAGLAWFGMATSPTA